MKSIPQIVLGATALSAVMLAAGAIDAGANSIRFALSETTLGEVNENDARVAIKGWAETIMQETGLRVSYDASVISTAEQVMQKIRAHTVDSFGFSAFEYVQVAPLVDRSIIVDETDARGGDEYLLLVHEDSGIRDVSGMRGKSLLEYKYPKMCLAGPWLETMLAGANLGSSEALFARKTSQVKLARVVLPVYFRQTDVCLVTRRGFETMSELNPQLKKTLRVVAASPRLLPLILGFHKDSPAERRHRFAEAMIGLYRSPSGRQTLMLFQGVRPVESDTSNLKSAVDLLAAYERLKGKQGGRK
jgi:phosphonate transport system substrate-binding protein